MNEHDLDLYLKNIANRLIYHMEESGRFRRLSNPVIPSILEEVYKPIVKKVYDECNDRIDLYQREIELLKGDLERLRTEKGLIFVGLIDEYRLYCKRDVPVEVPEES